MQQPKAADSKGQKNVQHKQKNLIDCTQHILNY